MYMNSKGNPKFHASYLAWLESLGVSYEEFGELLFAELDRLPAAERELLSTFDWWVPGTLTPAQHEILLPVLERVVDQARLMGLGRRQPTGRRQ